MSMIFFVEVFFDPINLHQLLISIIHNIKILQFYSFLLIKVIEMRVNSNYYMVERE